MLFTQALGDGVLSLSGVPETIIGVLLGAVIGSFLNVCILAWGSEPKGKIAGRRSACPNCGAQIAWYDNVPIFSWLLLRARCRHCSQPISPLYPLVELATAAIWGYFVWRHGLAFEAVRGAIFFTLLLGIAVSDLRAYLIPDEFSLGGLVLGLLLAATSWTSFTHALLGAAVGFGILWLVGFAGAAVFKQEAMGGGDIKMMAMVGSFVGWSGTLLTIFLGALLGSLIYVPLAVLGRRQLVPFGIFLAGGAAVTYLLGPALINWYLGMAGFR